MKDSDREYGLNAVRNIYKEIEDLSAATFQKTNIYSNDTYEFFKQA